MSKEPNIIITPTGIINRRDKDCEGDMSHVVERENFRVIGVGKAKRNRKIAGSDRYTTIAVGSNPFTWGKRYYTSNDFTKTFAFSGGSLYHVDNLGSTEALIETFYPKARPCSEIFKVSGNDLLLFSEGVDTGMYSYDGNTTPTFTKEESVTLNFVDMVSHLDRIFGIEENSDILYFSKNLDPFDYTDSTDAGQITIGAGRGSKNIKLCLLNETIYILKEDSIYVLQGRTPSEFVVRLVVPNVGCVSRGSVSTATITNSIYFFASNLEFVNFDGVNIKILSYNIAMGGDFTKNLNPVINLNKLSDMDSVFHDNLYRCTFTETGHTYNNMEYCFDSTNETDFFTRGNNVGCYISYDRTPDKGQLITGRSDTGLLMYQNRGLNWDNQATSPTMPIKLRTKFVGDEKPSNLRFKYAWCDAEVLGAEPIVINYLIDSRSAASDSRSEQFAIYGESKNLTNFIKISSQTDISDRQVLKHSGSKGQNIQFYIDQDKNNLDFGFSNIHVLAIRKNVKRSYKVGV